MNNHPLSTLIQHYICEYENLRENNLDLMHLAFHRKFGLLLRCPFGWDILGAIKNAIKDLTTKKIVVIFSSTIAYREIYSVLGDGIKYFSWHEIFTGMNVVGRDVRYIQRITAILAESDFVFFINPPSLPEVIDQVAGQTSGGLVVISGNEVQD